MHTHTRTRYVQCIIIRLASEVPGFPWWARFSLWGETTVKAESL